MSRYYRERAARRDGGFARDEWDDRPRQNEDRRTWDVDRFSRGQSFDAWAYGDSSVDSDGPQLGRRVKRSHH